MIIDCPAILIGGATYDGWTGLGLKASDNDYDNDTLREVRPTIVGGLALQALV